MLISRYETKANLKIETKAHESTHLIVKCLLLKPMMYRSRETH